jgi:hypothetical protein
MLKSNKAARRKRRRRTLIISLFPLRVGGCAYVEEISTPANAVNLEHVQLEYAEEISTLPTQLID